MFPNQQCCSPVSMILFEIYKSSDLPLVQYIPISSLLKHLRNPEIHIIKKSFSSLMLDYPWSIYRQRHSSGNSATLVDWKYLIEVRAAK